MSIRSRLVLLTLLATLLPALLGVVRFVQSREQTIEADTAQLTLIVQQQADTIAERIQGTAQLLYGLARADELLHGGDRPACSAFLAEVRAAYPQYTGILTIQPDGRLFCDALRSGRELDLRDHACFKAAQAAGSGVVLEPVFGRLAGLAVLQVAHPVRSARGELRFVLLASLNLQQLLEHERMALAAAKLLLLDDKGLVLARSRSDGVGDPTGSSMAGTPLFRLMTSGAAHTAEIAGARARISARSRWPRWRSSWPSGWWPNSASGVRSGASRAWPVSSSLATCRRACLPRCRAASWVR